MPGYYGYDLGGLDALGVPLLGIQGALVLTVATPVTPASPGVRRDATGASAVVALASAVPLLIAATDSGTGLPVSGATVRAWLPADDPAGTGRVCTEFAPGSYQCPVSPTELTEGAAPCRVVAQPGSVQQATTTLTLVASGRA